jgi:hypothetical protein
MPCGSRREFFVLSVAFSFPKQKARSPCGASGLFALTLRSVAMGYPFATRGLSLRMRCSRAKKRS